MNFDFTDDQQQIKRTARELLATRSPFERVRAAADSCSYDEALWRELCELGWPGIAIAEEHGGQGLGVVALAILLEELGYAVAASPLLSTALAALAIEHAGSAGQRARWLPVLASGQAVGHRCAEMLLYTEGARSAAYYAAWAADAAPDRLAEAASLPKAAASDAGREVTASAIQAHGGIGFTWEADVHWLYKRAQVDAATLGGARTHRARLARLVAERRAQVAV
jgi:alkylation response protein AidB-like acyl-CoA dehydrogenase